MDTPRFQKFKQACKILDLPIPPAKLLGDAEGRIVVIDMLVALALKYELLDQRIVRLEIKDRDL